MPLDPLWGLTSPSRPDSLDVCQMSPRCLQMPPSMSHVPRLSSCATDALIVKDQTSNYCCITFSMLWGVWYPEAAKTPFPNFGVKTLPRIMEIRRYHPNAFQHIMLCVAGKVRFIVPEARNIRYTESETMVPYRGTYHKTLQ
jgi:hypothetical protein